MSIYLELTAAFNAGRTRAVLSSGQAVVMHRLAVMSKDGDWILREDAECLAHILAVLERHGARYRFGAPLDVRWMRGGWSSHFEFRHEVMRVRTDFVTRPPRLPPDDLERMWNELPPGDIPYLDVRRLADIKKTNREKDYVIIGELARQMYDTREQLLYSRSARDIERLARRHPDVARELAEQRPVLSRIAEGIPALEAALDAERRAQMHTNEARLEQYHRTAQQWAAVWPDVERLCVEKPLTEAHRLVVAAADGVLPFSPAKADDG
jgi:hypothetical protein